VRPALSEPLTVPDLCAAGSVAGRAQLTVGLAYAFEEQQARARKAGLWSDPDPVAPWVSRQSKSAD